MNGSKQPPSSLDEQVEDLLSLVLARTRGEVGNDAVENVLSSIVSAHAPSSSLSGGDGGSNTANIVSRTTQLNKKKIIPDTDNYDDDSEDDAPNQKKVAATTKQKSSEISDCCSKKKSSARRDALENIPLGKMGERMLITFGDGPCPDLEVISATLLGTRATLQRAILDARALRRKQKDSWHQARAVANMHQGEYAMRNEMKKTTSGEKGSVVAIADNELSFRAMGGCNDGIRYDVPCGFDVRQLETLFPEEMGAYQRWKKMHDAYSEKSGEQEIPVKSEEDLTSDNKKDDELEPETSKLNSGRLIERLANFDLRTNQMGEDWYMKFADVRRGSFLPRLGRSSIKQNAETKAKKRGRPSTKSRTSWQQLNPASIIFLHWVGFDPTSALSPPNEETTQALGYLAYDFFGKIVEKAVSLRLNASKGENKKQKSNQSRSNSPLLELTGGDQLEKENVEKAIAEVKLNSLYSSSNVDLGKAADITQLYFGPGFEDRLELEMDELFGSKEKSLSKEEMEARKEEEHLFSELPEVPKLLSNVTTTLVDITSEENDTKQASANKKSRQS